MEPYTIKNGVKVSSSDKLDIFGQLVRGELNSYNTHLTDKVFFAIDKDNERFIYLNPPPSNDHLRGLSFKCMKVDKVISNLFHESGISKRPNPITYGKLIIFIGEYKDKNYVYYVNYNNRTMKIYRKEIFDNIDKAFIYRLGSEKFSDLKFNINNKTYKFLRNSRDFADSSLSLVESKDLEHSYAIRFKIQLGLELKPNTIKSFKVVTFKYTYFVYTFLDQNNRFRFVCEIYGKFIELPNDIFYKVRLSKKPSEMTLELLLRTTGHLILTDDLISNLNNIIEEGLKNG